MFSRPPVNAASVSISTLLNSQVITHSLVSRRRSKKFHSFAIFNVWKLNGSFIVKYYYRGGSLWRCSSICHWHEWPNCMLFVLSVLSCSPVPKVHHSLACTDNLSSNPNLYTGRYVHLCVAGMSVSSGLCVTDFSVKFYQHHLISQRALTRTCLNPWQSQSTISFGDIGNSKNLVQLACLALGWVTNELSENVLDL